MAKNRDPARDEAYILWKEAGGNKAPKGILKEIAEKLNVSEGTLRGWKAKDKWNVPMEKIIKRSKKETEHSDKKKQITQAKSMVINGSTIKEASTKTNINYNTLRGIATKENWIDLQRENMQEIYSELLGEFRNLHVLGRKNAIKHIHNLVTDIIIKSNNKSLDIKEITLKKEIVDYLLKSIKGQAELIGILSTEKSSEIELRKMQLNLEKEKFIITSELKKLEILTKSGNENTTDNENVSDIDEKLEKWVKEAWK